MSPVVLGLHLVTAESTWVVIEDGMHVLLDVSPPALGSITVQSGGTLVWGDVDGIKLSVSYILIHGEFHIGSNDCRFTKKANILLTGLSNTTLEVDGFGRKFLGVASGGIIELHGAEKLAWTKLAHSIDASEGSCGVVYEHSDTVYDKERGAGVQIIVWDVDGRLRDFANVHLGETWLHEPVTVLENFINGIPDGQVVAVAVSESLGLQLQPERDWERVYAAMEGLTGLPRTVLRDVNDVEAYAMVTVKGSPSTTMEQHKVIQVPDTYTQTDDVHVTMWDMKLKFWAESAIRSDNNRRHPNKVNFRVSSTDVAYPKVEVINDVSSWMKGDRIIVTSTDYDWKQVEEMTIYDCEDCSVNEFRLNGPFKYPHYGNIYDGVDMRAEVALLSRNVVIEGEMERQCYTTDDDREKTEWLCTLFTFDHFGGQFKIVKGFADAHIQGIELFHLGQQEFLGSYPLHYHMCDNVAGSWMRSNSIHHSFARCVTIHGSDYAEVSNNVCYDHLGHGFFLEDSAEQYNVIDGNLAVGAKHGTHVMTDMKTKWCSDVLDSHCDSLASFWMTHANNYVRNNVAAGSDNSGFWYIYAESPMGLSGPVQAEKALNNESAVTYLSAQHTPILEFDNNVAHSNVRRGFSLERRLSNGQMDHDIFIPENGEIGWSRYDPREPNNPKGTRVPSYISRLTVYKNRRENIWIRSSNTILVDCSISDSDTGLTMPGSTGHTFTEVINSVFIGMSDNKGVGTEYVDWGYTGKIKPRHTFDRSFPSSPFTPLQGFVFYQGPNFVTDCYFNDFSHWEWNSTWFEEFGIHAFRAAGAIGWNRHHKQFDPFSSVSGIKYGFCDKTEGNWVYDGTPDIAGVDPLERIQPTFKDEDGSVTGVAESQVVKDHPFFTTPKCSSRDNWQMNVCPHKYVKVSLHGVITVGASDSRPVEFIRDDDHANSISFTLTQGRSYNLIVNKSYTIHFTLDVPKEFEIRAKDMIVGDVIRIGICMPKDMTSYELRSRYPKIDRSNPSIPVDSIEALDADTSGRAHFWDQTIGMVFVKFTSNETRTDREQCPNGHCPDFKIVRHDGGNRADCKTTAYGPYVKDPEADGPEIPRPTCSPATSEGVGAGETRESTVPINGPDPLECPAEPEPIEEPTVDSSRGCARDSWRRDLGDMQTVLYSSMSRGFCLNKCEQEGFRFAGVQNSYYCFCGNSFGFYGSSTGCTKECRGNADTTCGGSSRNEIFRTSVAMPTVTSCGPDGRGFSYAGKCYYLGEESVKYKYAQKSCLSMGGHLATIPSWDVQDALIAYMGEGVTNVWIGLADYLVEGDYVFMDGTRPTWMYLGELEDKTGTSSSSDYFAMHSYYMYNWDDRSSGYYYKYMCQLPLEPTEDPFETCGAGDLGHRFGSDGDCYIVISTPMDHLSAEYQCFTHQGVLAFAHDDATLREMRDHLILFGNDIDYWSNNPGDDADSFMELEVNRLFANESRVASNGNGVICYTESDGLSCADDSPSKMLCSVGWVAFADSCYFYRGDRVTDFADAANLCNSGESMMLTVDSKAENDFVYNMVSDYHDGIAQSVLLGYRYRSLMDRFVTVHGGDIDYSNWAPSSGMTGLKDGYCAAITSSEMTWANTDCVKGDYALVCKMTL